MIKRAQVTNSGTSARGQTMGGYHDLAILTFSSSVAFPYVLIFLLAWPTKYTRHVAFLTHPYTCIYTYFIIVPHESHLAKKWLQELQRRNGQGEPYRQWVTESWKSWRAETALAMKYIRTFDSLGPCVPIGLSQLWSLWLCLAGRIVLLFLQSFCKLADSTCDLTGHKREDFRIEVGSNRLSCSVCSCISTSSHFIKVTALVEIPLSLWQL